MRHTLKAALLISSALIGTPALAQQQPQAPEHYALDPNGVDLVSGSFTYVANEVSIGDPHNGGLTHGRLFSKGWRDLSLGDLRISGSTYSVGLGAETEIFTRSGSTFTPQSNRGATLTISGTTLTYRTASGATAEFTTQWSAATSFYSTAAILLSVTTPAGEITTYTYQDPFYCSANDPLTGDCIKETQILRLQSVSNNRGYQLHYDYVENFVDVNQVAWLTVLSVTGINTAIDYCEPSNGACYGLTRNWPKVTYNTGYPTVVTDQSGRATQYGYGSGGLNSVTPPGESAPQFTLTHDAAGRVASFSGVNGNWTYTYTESGGIRTTVASGPDGQSTTVVSNLTIGRPSSVSNSLGQTYAFQYDSQRRVQRITRPEGDYTQYTYDGRGNVTETLHVPKPGSGLSNLTTSATFAAGCANPITCNQPTSTTDARGNVTDYTYDADHGGLLTMTGPAPTAGAARPQVRYSYSSLNAWYKNGYPVALNPGSPITLPTAASSCASGSAPSCIGTASEIRTTLTYGAAGVPNNLLPTTVTQRDGTGTLSASTATTYTPNGDVASADGPLSGADDTTTYRYDDARQMVGVIGPDPDGSGALLRRSMRYTYDPRGAVTLAEQGTVTGLTDPDWAAFSSLQQSAATYDVYGRVQQQRLLAGGTTFSLAQTSYDAAGRVDCVAMRMNTTSFSSPPTSACTAASPGAFGPDRIVRYGYDQVGRMNASTSGYGSGAPTTEAATYTANGLPQTLTDGNGNVSTLVYDGFDRLSQLRYPNPSGGGSSTTDYQEYGYDAGSNVISQRNRAGVVFTATYDNLNRNTALSASANFTPVAYTYDNLDRPLTASIPTQTTTMAWDALGRMTSETGPLGTMAYQYDLAGRRTRQTWPDGFFVTNSWNLADDMTAILHGGATQIVGFGYDDLGRRTGVTRGNGVSTSYAYDGASRLTGLSHDIAGTAADVSFGYTYNPAGQIVTKTTSNPAYVWTSPTGTTDYGIDGLNRVTSVNGAATTYGLNQQMTGDTVRTFNYDSAGRLLGVNGGASTLNYDALGRVFDYVGTNGGTHIYDGDEVAGFAPVGTATLQNRFIRGPGADEIVANYTSTASATPAYYWLLDERNSTLSAVYGATGVHAYINTYDEYGLPASSNLGRFQYTGQRWLPDFGLYDYKARAYHPGLGRFMQHDPIGYEDGANLYAYVGNDPINWIDPTGLAKMVVICVGPATDPETGEVIGKVEGTGAPQCTASAISGGGSGSFGGFPGWMFGGGGSGIGGAFPGGGSDFARPPITADPQYAPFQTAYQAASRDNWYLAIPAVAPLVLPLAADLIPYAATQAPAIVNEAALLTGPRGPLFGTRYGGNRALLNSNQYLRIGWGWKGSATEGKYVFRIGGDLVRLIRPNNPHINLW